MGAFCWTRWQNTRLFILPSNFHIICITSSESLKLLLCSIDNFSKLLYERLLLSSTERHRRRAKWGECGGHKACSPASIEFWARHSKQSGLIFTYTIYPSPLSPKMWSLNWNVKEKKLSFSFRARFYSSFLFVLTKSWTDSKDYFKFFCENC